jgi:hypothetical protein
MQTQSNLSYINRRHMEEATRIALLSAATNALSMAQWHLKSDAGSYRTAVDKAEQAHQYLKRLAEIG